MHHLLATALTALLLAAPAAAQQNAVKLTGPQIEALLSGNTAVGTLNGTAYRQYFRPDGVMLYAPEGGRTARGEWRVDAEAQEYQSRWRRDADWHGRFVMEWAGDHYWVSRTTPPTPFEVEEGKRLEAPEEDAAFCRMLAEGGERESLAVAGIGDGTCSRSLGLDGAEAVTCRWDFGYRTPKAIMAYDSLSERVAACGGEAGTPEDGVNHPDSYAQRIFSLEGRDVAVSLKDKAGRGASHVFLRIEIQD